MSHLFSCMSHLNLSESIVQPYILPSRCFTSKIATASFILVDVVVLYKIFGVMNDMGSFWRRVYFNMRCACMFLMASGLTLFKLALLLLALFLIS
jgi:hypothetical protein